MSENEVLTEQNAVEAQETEPTVAVNEQGPAQSAPKKPKRGFNRALWNRGKAWLYLLPTLVILAVFTVWPIINTVRMAFLVDYDGLGAVAGDTFKVGFGNFVSVTKGDVATKIFGPALANTMLFTVLTVPISTMLALLIAVALNSIKWLKKILQTIFFLPYVTNSIAIGMVFTAMFTMIIPNSNSVPLSVGLINNIIQAFGGKAIDWVNSPAADGTASVANYAVVMMYIIWNALPFKILILLGGLQSVNKQYYDAAKIDGTSRFRTFWRITVPMLSPMLAYVIITGFIGGFKEYTSVVAIFDTQMGPAGTQFKVLNTVVGFVYDKIEGNNPNYGQASAAAIILFLIIFAVTLINLYVSKKRVHY